MSTEHVEARIREAHLIVASPEAVWSALQNYGSDPKTRYFSDADLEKSLLARTHPLIDLGLARYGGEREVVAALYKKTFDKGADHLQQRYLRGLRLACLSNRNLSGFMIYFPEQPLGKEEVARLIHAGDEEETAAIFANPLASHLLESLYAKKDMFAEVEDERWRMLVMYSAANPRLADDQDSEDGPDLFHYGVHRAIVSMLRTAPTTGRWLAALRYLLDRLNPQLAQLPDAPIQDVLERWAQAKLDEEDEKWNKESDYTELTRLDEFRCVVAAFYGAHYDKTGGKYTHVVDGSPNSPDIATRCAYYGNADLSLAAMNSAYARDKQAFVLALLHNESMFYKPHFQKFIEQGVFQGPLYYVYKRRKEQYDEHRVARRKRLLDEDDEQQESNELTLPKQVGEALAAIAARLSSVQTWGFWGFVAVLAVLFYKLR